MKTLKAKCVQIRQPGNVQVYETDSPDVYLQVISCQGFDRAKEVQPGDVGTMTYISTTSCGYWSFQKDAG